MTKEEAAIVAAYTGYLIGEFSEMHKYIEKKMGRPVWTHEMADREFAEEIRKQCKDDFISIKIVDMTDSDDDGCNCCRGGVDCEICGRYLVPYK